MFWPIVLFFVTIGLHWLSAKSGGSGIVASIALCLAAGIAVIPVWIIASGILEGHDSSAYVGLAAVIVVMLAILVAFPLVRIVVRQIAAIAVKDLRARQLIEIGLGAAAIALLFALTAGRDSVSWMETVVLLSPILAGWTLYDLALFESGNGSNSA